MASKIYIAMLLTVEYVGYYMLGIRINADNPSLLGLGVIHGPAIVHWFYVLAGPLYLLTTRYMRVS